MWVPMTEWTILMLHGVARLPATAAGLETASRFKRRKDFPGATGAQIASLKPRPSIPDSWALGERALFTAELSLNLPCPAHGTSPHVHPYAVRRVDMRRIMPHLP